MSEFPAAPALVPMTQIALRSRSACVTSAPHRWASGRYVPLGGGSVRGPELQRRARRTAASTGRWLRGDGALEIAAHYVIRADDGALVEVRSEGLRHGPAEVMARLARGEAVPRDAYFFRTLIRFTTGASRLAAPEQGDGHRLRPARGAPRAARRLPPA